MEAKKGLIKDILQKLIIECSKCDKPCMGEYVCLVLEKAIKEIEERTS